MTMRVRLAATFFAAACLAGCGSGGDVVVGEFQQIVIGPGGGVAAAQNVRLVIPPGAFTEDHVVEVLEQPFPLPIETPTDGSTIVYHDNIMCIGPLDLPLLVDGHLRMCYPDSGYPKGLDEDDLVLLEWDEEAGLMRVVAKPTQDTDADCFEDFDYERLGHVAIGLRIPGDDRFDLVAMMVPEPVDQVPAGRIVTAGLVLGDIDGALDPLLIPDTSDANDYLGRPEGNGLLYVLEDSKAEASSLHTTDVPSLDTREVLAQGDFRRANPFFGWHGTDGSSIYFNRFGISPQGDVQTLDAFSTVPYAGGAFDDLFAYDQGDMFLEDVRYSPDGLLVLLRFFSFQQKSSRSLLVVLDELGNVLSSGLPTEVDYFDPMPRFLPDSSAIYYVADDGVTVRSVLPDGTGETTIYALPEPQAEFVDFVVAPVFNPAPQRCFYVRRDFGNLSSTGTMGTFDQDVLVSDELAGGDVHVNAFFGTTVQVQDLVPLQGRNWSTSLVALQLVPSGFGEIDVIGNVSSAGGQFFFPSTYFFSLDDASLWREVPVPLAFIDFSHAPGLEGHALASIPFTDTESFPEYPSPGLYHLDPFLGNATDVTPVGYDLAGPGRWLQSWRHAPGFSPFFGVR
jgi:hypothetical protein